MQGTAHVAPGSGAPPPQPEPGAPSLDDRTRQWRERRAGELWAAGFIDRRERWDVTDDGHRVCWLRVRRWHRSRAESLMRGWDVRVSGCGELDDSAVVQCTACGCTHPVYHRCGMVRVCRSCARRAWGRARSRMLPALADAVRSGDWAPTWHCDDDACSCRAVPAVTREELRLLTLTVRHSGDLDADRQRLQRGWVRLRAWFAARGLRKPRMVRVVEVTPGRDDLGHVHAHVVALLPALCFHWLRREWASASEDEGAAFVDVQRPRTMSAEAAARYLATYATKGDDLPPELRAAWLCASYGKRAWTASRGLVEPAGRVPCPEPGCGELSLTRVPVAVVSADAPRGPPPVAWGVAVQPPAPHADDAADPDRWSAARMLSESWTK